MRLEDIDEDASQEEGQAGQEGEHQPRKVLAPEEWTMSMFLLILGIIHCLR